MGSRSNNKKYYDVAISFLSQDEEYAKKLYEALQGRLEVFYYAERQDELVGKDGEETFGEVFRDIARVVIVFYRKGWGETMMTRAERSAIKQRAAKEGYNFSIWVPVGDEKSLPTYIDPQFIWYDINRWQIEGLAAIVEKRVQESGREVRPESILDQLERIKRRIEIEKQRASFETSMQGVNFVNEEFSRLGIVVKEKIDKYQSVSNEIKFSIKNETDRVIIDSWSYITILIINRWASNSIREASLDIHIRKSNEDISYNREFEEVAKYSYKPTLDENGEAAWFREGHYYDLRVAISVALDNMAKLVYSAYEKRISSR